MSPGFPGTYSGGGVHFLDQDKEFEKTEGFQNTGRKNKGEWVFELGVG